MPTAGGSAAGPSPGRLATLVTASVLVVAALVALGTWQVHRLAWKTDLIARVDARVHAPPVAPPGPALWPSVDADRDEYRHVRVHGRYLASDETLVQAVTEFGAGSWVLAPFRTDDGMTLLIDRGFVPQDRRAPADHAPAPAGDDTTVTGLLRISEPGGAFLRRNDPAEDRWYSRDVAAIAAKRGLGLVAPYFIDADATPNPGGFPIGGLTVIAFPNNHLVYAITWYTLAAMLAGATVWLLRDALGPNQDRDSSA